MDELRVPIEDKHSGVSVQMLQDDVFHLTTNAMRIDVLYLPRLPYADPAGKSTLNDPFNSDVLYVPRLPYADLAGKSTLDNALKFE